MPRRQSRKGAKEARRRKKLREEARRPRAKRNEKDPPGEELERVYIDPFSMVAVRDLHKNTQLFWQHSTIFPDHLRKLSAASSTSKEVLFEENAQVKVQSLIEGMLKAVHALVAKYEAVRWLLLIRANLTKFLGEFMDGRGYSHLSPQDRLGVLGMLELAVTEYGLREDYFKKQVLQTLSWA